MLELESVNGARDLPFAGCRVATNTRGKPLLHDADGQVLTLC